MHVDICICINKISRRSEKKILGMQYRKRARITANLKHICSYREIHSKTLFCLGDCLLVNVHHQGKETKDIIIHCKEK